jgi:hypothetical protein
MICCTFKTLGQESYMPGKCDLEKYKNPYVYSGYMVLHIFYTLLPMQR